jgi:hypothetical protein
VNLDYLLASFDRLGLNYLLLTGFESSLVLSLAAHPLHRCHDIGLLCEKGVTQICCPLDISRQTLNHIGSYR